MMKKIKKTLVLMLGIFLFCGMGLSAYAADSAEIDFDKTGTVTLTLETSEGETVSRGAVTIYQVASLYLDDGSMAYACTEDFADLEADLEDVESASLPALLEEYVQTNAVTGTDAEIGSSGTVTFENLELGLYLIVQTAESDHYETINPFAVTVPMEVDGEWVYTVDASPKVGTVTLTETTESGGEIEESDEGTDESGETADATAAAEDAAGTAAASTLPQTGQLFWPIPVLAVCGIVLFILGGIMKRPGKAERTA